MKKLFSFLMLIGLIFSFQSCADLEGLDPDDSIPSDGAINNFASAASITNGVYDEMQDPTLVFDGWLALSQYFSDECVFTGTFPTRLEFGNYNVFPANTTMAAVFSDLYDVINIANTVIVDVAAIEDPSLTAAAANNFVAQARFVRAMTYLHLTTMWGDVPLVLTPTRADQIGELEIGTDPQSAVYTQIIEDLEFAETNLTSSGPSRANAQAATALLARTYLYQGNYPDALTKAEQALGDGFDLTAFAYLKDEIFSLNFTSIDGNSLPFFYGPAELGGRHSIEPSLKLINAYEVDDLRRDLSIDTSSASVPYGVKYPSFAQGPAGASTDPIFFIRHAEMCLIVAEAAAEASDFTKANTFFNMVRTRAGLDPLTLDGSNYVDLILQERFVELAMEGAHRLNDLRRRGRAESELGSEGYDACDDVWPIPQRELDRNTIIQQNDCCNC
ncbi:MAG: RagB/SusD family nutrient uptake outer membrane protein [Bacteroidota bacterium]